MMEDMLRLMTHKFDPKWKKNQEVNQIELVKEFDDFQILVLQSDTIAKGGIMLEMLIFLSKHIVVYNFGKIICYSLTVKTILIMLQLCFE